MRFATTVAAQTGPREANTAAEPWVGDYSSHACGATERAALDDNTNGSNTLDEGPIGPMHPITDWAHPADIGGEPA